MYSDARRIHLLERLLQEQNDAVLIGVEQLLINNRLPSPRKHDPISDLVGSIHAEDIDAIERDIEEGCEQIHPNEWKNPLDE